MDPTRSNGDQAMQVDQFGRAVRRPGHGHRNKPYDRPGNRPGGGYRGGRGGGRYNNSRPTAQDLHRVEVEELEKRLTSLIIKIGDKLGSGLAFNLEALAGVLAKDYDAHSTVVLRAFQGVVTELPMKTETYATLVGLLNVRQPAIARAVVDMAWEQLVGCAREYRRWKVVKLWLRFFALLVPVRAITAATFVELLGEFTNAVLRDDPELQDPKRADALLYTVAVTLPYVGRELQGQTPAEFEALLGNLHAYARRPNSRPRPEILTVFPGLPDNFTSTVQAQSPAPYYQYQTNPFGYVMDRLAQLAARQWETPLVHRTYLGFTEALQAAEPIDLPLAALSLPAPSNPYILAAAPEEADAETAEVPLTTNPGETLSAQIQPLQAALRAGYASKSRYGHVIPTPWVPVVADPDPERLVEHFLVYDLILDITDIFHVNRRDAATFLVNLPGYLPESVWCRPASATETTTGGQDDPMAETAPAKVGEMAPPLAIDQMVVGALFSRLFELPSPPHKAVYYAALAIELCKLSGDRMLPGIAATVTRLFQTLPCAVPWTHLTPETAVADDDAGSTPAALELVARDATASVAWDAECIHRLADWFAMYLSNCGYTWKWTDWAPVLTSCQPASPALVFTREVLYKCIRLSYFDRVKITVPDDLQSVVLPPVSLEPQFRYRNAAGEPAVDADGNPLLPEPVREFAAELINHLQRKESVESLQAFIEAAYGTTLAGIPVAELRPIATAAAGVYAQSAAAALGQPGHQPALEDLATEANALPRVVRDVFVQTILYLGSKSFSHMLNVIERYLPLLQRFSTDSAAKLHIVEIVNEFWVYNPQFVTIIIDKLLNYRVVDPTAVIAWALNPLRLTFEYPAPFYVWEILRNTVHKIESRIVQIERRLTNQRALLGSNNSGGGGTESIIHTVDPSLAETIARLEATLSGLRLEQKELLLSLFQSFVALLSQLLRECSANGVDPTTYAPYLWIEGRYREFIRTYHGGVKRLATTLETIVFTNDLNPQIINVFREALSL
ncbi:Nuclear cap-binding protein subunit 1 [Tieghemiomyces parasiticus]|uniref:Nuclear cap-binding protein subunit 1 n=1 Tax=Tieghemiomyces parasiticus TaxID=78921 RepID=A0A9W8A7P9_9FUNG|nr:Nuclear cap-binding protein subunit 1 [Tieghemiomyces parasiticus]